MNTQLHQSAIPYPDQAPPHAGAQTDLLLPATLGTADRPPGEPHINIFALPDQVKILIVLLALSLYTALIAIGAVSAAPFGPIVIGILFLSLRSLLAWPERECRKRKLVAAGARFPALQHAIAELSAQLGLTYVPRLMIAPGHATPAVFGSWRRWYIQVGADYATELCDQLRDQSTAPTAQAVLIHELQHFKHGDTVWNGYARALLRTSVGVVVWAALFLIGLALLLQFASGYFLTHSPADMAHQFETMVAREGLTNVEIPPDMFMSMAEWEDLREKVSATDYGLLAGHVFLNTFGVTLITGSLLVFLWRRLLKMREFYADAGVVHLQRDTGPLLQGVATAAIQPDTAGSGIAPGQQQLADLWHRLWAWLPSGHPSPRQRRASLRDPARVYGSWYGSAILIGAFVVVIELLLSGTSALLFYGNWPLHFPVLTIVLLVSLYILVPLVAGRPVWRTSVQMVLLAFTPHIILLIVVLIILWLLVLLVPTYLDHLLDWAISALAGYLGLDSDEIFRPEELGAFAFEASIINLLQVPAMVLLTLGTVWGNIWLSRHILTWYGFAAGSKRLMWVVYGTIGLSSLVLAFGVLPIVTDLVLLRFAAVFSPWQWLATGASLLAAIAWGSWFWHQHRTHARTCPHCHAAVPGDYHTTRTCAACGHLLHPWLLAYYTDSARSPGDA